MRKLTRIRFIMSHISRITGRNGAALVLLISLSVASFFAAKVSMWGPDQSVTYAQACRALNLHAYPLWGLLNSLSFRNTNAMVLMTIPLATISKNPFIISLLLSLIQTVVVVWGYFRSCSTLKFKPNTFVSITLLLFFVLTPNFLMTTTEVYAQFFCRTMTVALFAVLLMVFNENEEISRPAWFLSFFIGILIFLLPAVHLATFSYYPALFLILVLAFRRGKLNLAFWGFGVLSVFVLVWVPWSYFCMPSAISSLASNNSEVFNSLSGAAGMLREFFSTFGESSVLRGCPDFDSPSFKIQIVARIVFFCCASALAVFDVRRRRNASITAALALLSLVLVVNVVYGRVRSDYLLNFSTAFFLAGALLISKWTTVFTKFCRIHHPRSKRIFNLAMPILTLAAALLWCRIFELKYKHQANFHPFDVSDVPLYDKTSILDGMIEKTTLKSRDYATFSLLNRDYQKVFGFILYFQAIDIDQLYGEDTFQSTYLNNIQSHTVFKCVSFHSEPDFIIAYASSKAKHLALKGGKDSERILYDLIKSGVFQKLYKKRE